MEKVIRTNNGSVILITYYTACDPSPSMNDGNGVPVYMRYNDVKEATMYTRDVNSGRTVQVSFSAADLINLANGLKDIQFEGYEPMTKSQYDDWVC